MAVKDLSMARYIKDLIDLGVTSLKIEGRMRSIYYIATVIHIYRKIIDDYCSNPLDFKYNEQYEYELYRCANREAVPQYFEYKPGVEEQYYLGREEVSNQDFLGVVLDYDEINKEIILEQRNFFKVGDEITIFGPNIDNISIKVEYIKDDKQNLIDAARHPQQIVRIPCGIKVYKNNIIRVKFYY
jgi:putative protease